MCYLLPVLHAASQGRRSGEDPAQSVRFGIPVSPRAHRDTRCHHEWWRSDDAERSETGVPLPTAPGDPAHRDHPDRESHYFASAGTNHTGVLRDGAEVPPHLHEHALQSPERADAGCRRLAGSPVESRSLARLPDGAAQRRQRRPQGDDETDARAAESAGATLLPLYGGPGGGWRAFPHDGAEGSRDHAGAARMDLGYGRTAIRDRLSRWRRKGAAAARVPRIHERRRSGLPELRGQALRLQAAPHSACRAGRARAGGRSRRGADQQEENRSAAANQASARGGRIGPPGEKAASLHRGGLFVFRLFEIVAGQSGEGILSAATLALQSGYEDALTLLPTGLVTPRRDAPHVVCSRDDQNRGRPLSPKPASAWRADPARWTEVQRAPRTLWEKLRGVRFWSTRRASLSASSSA